MEVEVEVVEEEACMLSVFGRKIFDGNCNHETGIIWIIYITRFRLSTGKTEGHPRRPNA